MTTRLASLALGCSLLALGACGDDSTGTGGNAVNLVGRSFAATTADGFELPAAAHLVIRFAAGELGVSGGCNGIGGEYRIDGNVLVADQGFAQTEIACDEPLMQLDTDVVALLGSKPTLAVNGATLTITGPSGTLTLTEEQAPADLPLEGTAWTVTTLLDGDVASGGFAVQPTLLFQGGQVQVFAGCNSGSATAAIGDTAIELGPLGLTKMACDKEAMRIEAAIVALFDSSVDYRIDGTALEIIGATGGLIADGAIAD